MALDPVTAITDLVSTVGGKLIDRLFPDKVAQAAQRDQAALLMLTVQNDAELKQLQASLSAILAEAQSADPWTSRARPSFMYVIYIMILAALPMALVFAFAPESAAKITQGLGLWLKAIPDSLYTLFGVGYLGYTSARSYDKKNGTV